MDLYLTLNSKLKTGERIGIITILLSCVDLIFGIMAIFLGFFLLPSVIASTITGIVLCIGYGMYNKFSKRILFAATEEQLKSLNKIKAFFGKENIVLSVLDSLVGLIAIVVIGQMVNNMIASVILCISIIKNLRITSTAISSVIQMRKFKALFKIGGLLSVTYIAVRKNHFLKKGGINMKSFFKWLKANPRTLMAILSIVGSVGLVVLEQLQQIAVGPWVPIVSVLLGTLGVIFTGWAGFELPSVKEVRDTAVKEHISKQKADEEFIAKAQAQLQAQQDAQVKKLAEQLKASSDNISAE